MKIDFKMLAGRVIAVVAPVLALAVARKVLTGKIDIRAAALEAALAQLANRQSLDRTAADMRHAEALNIANSSVNRAGA